MLRSSKKDVENVVGRYLETLYRYPQLKKPEVVELFKEYSAGCVRNEEGDVISRTDAATKVRKKLTECNLRLVVSIAKQYAGHNLPIEDLIQEGNIGLMKAIDRFKWEKGFMFSTYATWWIKQSIGQHVLKRKRMIRLPAHAANVQKKMLQAMETFKDTNGGEEPSAEQLKELVGASETVMKATIHSGRNIISLQQPLSSSGEGDTIEEKVEDDGPNADPFQNVADKQLIDIVRKVLDTLSDKENAILRLRFGLIDENINADDYPITEEEALGVLQGKGLT